MDDQQANSSALIIDDKRDLAELLALRLSLDGIKCLVATSGSEGIRACSTRAFDAAFVDYRLPDMSGLAAAAELKKIRPSIKVILITGDTYSLNDTEVVSADIDKVLPKPWRPSELEALIRTIRRPA